MKELAAFTGMLVEASVGDDEELLAVELVAAAVEIEEEGNEEETVVDE